jgi:hypothetical protein
VEITRIRTTWTKVSSCAKLPANYDWQWAL